MKNKKNIEIDDIEIINENHIRQEKEEQLRHIKNKEKNKQMLDFSSRQSKSPKSQEKKTNPQDVKNLNEKLPNIQNPQNLTPKRRFPESDIPVQKPTKPLSNSKKTAKKDHSELSKPIDSSKNKISIDFKELQRKIDSEKEAAQSANLKIKTDDAVVPELKAKKLSPNEPVPTKSKKYSEIDAFLEEELTKKKIFIEQSEDKDISEINRLIQSLKTPTQEHKNQEDKPIDISDLIKDSRSSDEISIKSVQKGNDFEKFDFKDLKIEERKDRKSFEEPEINSLDIFDEFVLEEPNKKTPVQRPKKTSKSKFTPNESSKKNKNRFEAKSKKGFTAKQDEDFGLKPIRDSNYSSIPSAYQEDSAPKKDKTLFIVLLAVGVLVLLSFSVYYVGKIRGLF